MFKFPCSLKKIDFRKLFETDSKIVTYVIYHNRTEIFEFSSLITNIKRLLLFYSNFEVKFIKRPMNIVAHTLTRTKNIFMIKNIFF
jgi:hypothetical protein